MTDTFNWFICDLDGTLFDINHRRHHVRNGKKNWKAFNAEIINDTPIQPVLTVVRSLMDNGNACVYMSGRNEASRTDTVRCLGNALVANGDLFMRADGDYRRDDIIKEELLDVAIAKYGNNPMFVIDDRKQVVDMWQRRGIYTFDVGQGKGDF